MWCRSARLGRPTLATNVSQIGEGTNSVGIVRWDLGFCLCAVSRWHGLISTNFNNNDNDKTRSNRSNESRGKGYAPIF